jgi:hypothetical protein
MLQNINVEEPENATRKETDITPIGNLTAMLLYTNTMAMKNWSMYQIM